MSNPTIDRFSKRKYILTTTEGTWKMAADKRQ